MDNDDDMEDTPYERQVMSLRQPKELRPKDFAPDDALNLQLHVKPIYHARRMRKVADKILNETRSNGLQNWALMAIALAALVVAILAYLKLPSASTNAEPTPPPEAQQQQASPSPASSLGS